jgi:hypothetical protein
MAGLVLAMLAGCGDSGDAKDSGAAFCDAARAAQAATNKQQKLFDAQDAPGSGELKPVIDDFAAKSAALPGLAPAEIKPEVDALNEAAQALLAVVQANNYDAVAMIPTPEFGKLNEVIASAAYQAAKTRFQSYLDTNCTSISTPGT